MLRFGGHPLQSPYPLAEQGIRHVPTPFGYGGFPIPPPTDQIAIDNVDVDMVPRTQSQIDAVALSRVQARSIEFGQPPPSSLPWAQRDAHSQVIHDGDAVADVPPMLDMTLERVSAVPPGVPLDLVNLMLMRVRSPSPSGYVSPNPSQYDDRTSDESEYGGDRASFMMGRVDMSVPGASDDHWESGWVPHHRHVPQTPMHMLGPVYVPNSNSEADMDVENDFPS